MESIQIAGKNFELASPWKRLFALFIDVLFLICFSLLVFVFCYFLFTFVIHSVIVSGINFVRTEVLDYYSSQQNPFTPNLIIGPATIDFYRYLRPKNFSFVGLIIHYRFPLLGLWIFGLFFMDGYKNGQSPGKSALNIQVRSLKDGKPCGFKDSFIRRFIGIFQPLDFLFTFGKKRQRLGGKLTGTVVVKQFLEEIAQIVPENAVPRPNKIEEELETVMHKMENEISAARQKVEASISAEKRFQNEHEKNLAEAEQCYKNAADALKIGHEDSAREELKKRDEYLRLAEQQKKQWVDQKQSVEDFNDVLVSLQQEMMAAEVRGTTVLAQHRNVATEAYLRETLKEMRDSKALEKVVDLEQDAIEDVILAKAMTEADNITHQDIELEREFLDYAEERSIDEELAALQEAIDTET